MVATEDVAPGTVVARFVGPEVPYADVPGHEVVYVLSFVPHLWLIPEPPARFLNHSCDPNCEIRPDRDVAARRAVRAGDELTISYDWADPAEVRKHPDHYFWDERWSFDCRCGTHRCVGRVDRYLPADRLP